FKRVNDKILKLTSFANLKSGVAVAAFFAHKVTALSILADMYKKRLIDDKEVIIASIIGMFPMGIRIVILLLAPVAISALGLKLGTIYVFLEILSRFLVALIGVYLGRKYLTGGVINYTADVSLKNSIFDTFKQFFRVLLVLIPSIFVAILLLDLGFNSLVSHFNLKASQLIILVTGTSSTIAGLGVTGSLLAKNEVDGRIALILLMIASAFHRIVESLRFSMPINVSLFGSFGIRLTMILLLMNELALLFGVIGLLIIFTLGIA
ncbi:MAG: hypothetical protein J7K36_11425, partial [Archaeoglobaceae archaeon]|nr:hypothetical protein [Archaeoglobaceae archaeon]